MNKQPSLTDTDRIRTIEVLQKALDQTYRRVLETAKADWDRLFAGQDPSDGSIRVRISNAEMVEELAGIPRTALAQARRRRSKSRSRRPIR